MEKTKVAIIGMGTVGQGVARLLVDHGDRTARHAGRTLWLEKAVVKRSQEGPQAGTAHRRAYRQCRRSDQQSRDQGRRSDDRRVGAGADDHAAAVGKRQGRRHREQGPAGRARAGVVRSGSRAGPLDRVRSLRGRRHSRSSPTSASACRPTRSSRSTASSTARRISSSPRCTKRAWRTPTR